MKNALTPIPDGSIFVCNRYKVIYVIRDYGSYVLCMPLHTVDAPGRVRVVCGCMRFVQPDETYCLSKKRLRVYVAHAENIAEINMSLCNANRIAFKTMAKAVERTRK